MRVPDVGGACRYALQRLEQELAPQLYYHSVAHTRDDVVPAVEQLAHSLSIIDEPLLLARTAAWYHDLGFIEQCDGHEAVSARIAIATLPSFGYTSEQVDGIVALIMATRMPQNPQSPLEMLLADADLDSLGRPDFLKTSLALHAELEVYGQSLSMQDWYARQLQFLQQHRYFTSAARRLRDAGKQQNILCLAQLLHKERSVQKPFGEV